MSTIMSEVHIITAGSGGAGKTTLLMNLLAYWSQKDVDSTSVIVVDFGDNTDVAELWMPGLMIAPEKKSKYFEYFAVSKSRPQITVIQRTYNHAEGFKWKHINEIVVEYYEQNNLKRISGNHRIIVLVDTGGSPNSIFSNAHNILLDKRISWFIHPWILWTPNSLANDTFINSTKFILSKLKNDIASTGKGKWYYQSINVVNPSLVDYQRGSVGDRGVLDIVRNLLADAGAELIPMGHLKDYSLLPTNHFIDDDIFLSQLELMFFRSRILETVSAPLDVYNLIGKVLKEEFVSNENCPNGNSECKYANILCVAHFDKRLLSIKQSPRDLKDGLAQIKRKKRAVQDTGVKSLHQMFGEIYKDIQSGLDDFLEVRKELTGY